MVQPHNPTTFSCRFLYQIPTYRQWHSQARPNSNAILIDHSRLASRNPSGGQDRCLRGRGSRFVTTWMEGEGLRGVGNRIMMRLPISFSLFSLPVIFLESQIPLKILVNRHQESSHDLAMLASPHLRDPPDRTNRAT